MVVILQQTQSENGKRFTSTVVAESPTSPPTSNPNETSTSSNTNFNSEDHQNHHQEETTSSSSSQTGGSGGIPSPYNSNFSFASQNSISERSAIYKQRIDSLFGRHSRLTPFKPNLERFCIRIDGTGVNLSPNMMSSSSLVSPGSSASSGSSSGNHLSKSKNLQQHNHIHPAPFEEADNHILSSSAHDDDDDSDSDIDQNYQKIEKKLIQHKRKSKKINQSSSSIVTDSLSKSVGLGVEIGNASMPMHSGGGLNVSSVQINCEEPTCSGSGGSFSGSISISPRSSKDEPICPINNSTKAIISNDQIWRNGNYSTKSPQEIKHSTSGRNEPCALLSPTGVLRFPVEYLGSIPVEGSTTTLHDLQIPLRVLYMDFLQNRNISTGQLAITSDGLKFESSKLRLVNPFTTIAVWAAIKFVARCNTSECAFMPLISDPEGQDKKSLFGKMDSELAKVYFSCINTGNKNFRNPPIFACVMREASYILECHAFATKCPEDAIVIAANLYQSLVDKMRSSKKEGESGYSSSSPANPHLGLSPTNQNNRSISSASNDKLSSSSCSHTDDADHQQHPVPILCMSTTTRVNREKLRVVFSDSESIIPVRPPRRKKKGGGYYALGGCGDGSDKKRYNSDDSILKFSSSKKKIPQRRKSFKSSHNFYHYQTRQQQPFIQHHSNYISKKGTGIMSGGGGGKRDDKKKRVKISVPLTEEELAITGGGTDFSEPINDSIDQVLDRIINPGGMSWNDLKPGYQELILKIALTLTQDQLYQKSKQAMKKHQNQLIYVNGGGRKQKPKSKFTSKSSNRTDSNEDSQFLNQLLKSFSKIGGTNNKVSGSPPQPPPRNKLTDEDKSEKNRFQSKAILKKRIINKCTGRDNADTIGQDSLYSFCSGCICENCSEKCYCSLPSKQNLKFVTTLPSIAASPINPTPSPTLQISQQDQDPITSEEIDILPNQDHKQQSDIAQKHVPKSSATTSEKSVIKKKTCGYDTESCAESEKCYCSLQRVKSNGLKIYNINLDTETSDTDTNSYDFEPFNQDDDQVPSCSSAVKTNSAKSTVEVLSYNQGRFSYSQSPTSGNSPLFQTTTNAQIHVEEKNVDKTPFLSPHQKNGLLLGKAVAEIAAKRIASHSSKMQSGNGRQSDLEKRAMNSGEDDEIHTSDENSKNSKKEKVLLITGASNPSAKVIYKEPNGFHYRKDTISRGWRNLSENDEDAESENSDDDDDDIVPEKMISMKKTAEIAAMFSQLRVDKKCRGDVRLLGKKIIDPENTNTEESVDFESSLGYLP